MKKGICILLSSALLMGTVPVYGNDVEQVTHTYRAEVGTKNFYKDDVLQTLDTEIYLKDGYVMLPVRTFLQRWMKMPKLYGTERNRWQRYGWGNILSDWMCRKTR